MITFISRASILDYPIYLSLNEYISAFMFESLLYGILLVLSFVASVLLIKNKSSNHWQWLLTAGAVMLAMATADLILGYYILFARVLKGQLVLPFRLFYPKYFLYVTNNIIADCLVIYRCYMIWGRDKRVIALPTIVLLASSVCGYVFQGGTSPRLRRNAGVYVFMTFFLNLFVSCLMAARIWWISRKVRAVLGKDIVRKYHYATAIIIESGTIYSIYLLLDLILATPQLNVGLVQIVAIVPTLIIVQVGLGRHTRDVHDTIQLVQSGSQPDSSRRCASEIRFTPGVRSTATSV